MRFSNIRRKFTRIMLVPIPFLKSFGQTKNICPSGHIESETQGDREGFDTRIPDIYRQLLIQRLDEDPGRFTHAHTDLDLGLCERFRNPERGTVVFFEALSVTPGPRFFLPTGSLIGTLVFGVSISALLNK
jgi:hypothetical protein